LVLNEQLHTKRPGLGIRIWVWIPLISPHRHGVR
jgi:hypothetical protein